MNIKQGDTVKVDGRESTVTSSWGQGKHKAYALADGRTALNLTVDQLVEKVKSHPLNIKDIVKVQPMTKLDEDDLQD